MSQQLSPVPSYVSMAKYLEWFKVSSGSLVFFLVNRKVGLTACKYLLFCDGMNFKIFFRGATPNLTRTLFCYMYSTVYMSKFKIAGKTEPNF